MADFVVKAGSRYYCRQNTLLDAIFSLHIITEGACPTKLEFFVKPGGHLEEAAVRTVIDMASKEVLSMVRSQRTVSAWYDRYGKLLSEVLPA